ncbi:hypothetical protein EW026_g1968 [Hermanssonia centrifuga]|uniref:DUF6533 domain-containing protein n=1 Tax=Hermanssonia centrifuga TaxID=98765 RepID=A0A4S4KUA3_9APHY|nr:hypothetical protein EW026_g1968 [Hermanssonia centrifuga]
MGSSKSATIEEARALMVDEFVIYAMMALVSYEYLLTIRQEISMIWRRKHTAVTWLFVSNRYLMLASFIIAVATASPQT